MAQADQRPASAYNHLALAPKLEIGRNRSAGLVVPCTVNDPVILPEFGQLALDLRSRGRSKDQ